MIHLDTDFLIRGLSRGSPEDRRLRSWLATGEPVGISAVSWVEFLCGPAHAGDVELAIRIVGEPLPFLGDDGPLSARLFNLGGRRRGSLGEDRKSTRLNSSHLVISYAVFCLKKKK